MEKLTRVADTIASETGHRPEIEFLELDKPDSVRSFAASWAQSHNRLDILINNYLRIFAQWKKEFAHLWFVKTIPQGAATSCWAAPALNGKTGLYLEDCQIAKAGSGNFIEGGYAPYAYDVEGAKKLWAVSNQLLATEF